MTPFTGFASALLFVGLWLLGHKRRSGFLFSIVGELAWVKAAVDRGMYDLSAVCVVFAVMAALNWRKWGEN